MGPRTESGSAPRWRHRHARRRARAAAALVGLALTLIVVPSARAQAPPSPQSPADGASFTQNTPIGFSAYDAIPPADVYAMETYLSRSNQTDEFGRILWGNGGTVGPMTRSGSTWSWTWGGTAVEGTHYWQVVRTSYDAFHTLHYYPSTIRSFTIGPPPPPPPDTAITSGPSGPTNDATPTFTFLSDQGGSTFECQMDGGGFASCSSPYTSPVLGEGLHSFDVRAINAGRTDPSPANRSFTVDTQAPGAVTIDGTTPASPSSDTSPEVRGTGAEPDSTVTIYGDATCSGPVLGSGPADSFNGGEGITATVPADATTSLRATATDAAGNVSTCSAPLDYVNDATPPDTIIDSGPSGPTSSNDPSFSFHATEPGSTFACRLDAGAWAGCTSPRSYTDLADGAHTFAVRATDAVGNTDTTPATRDFSIDATAPPRPQILDTDPDSPANDNAPEVRGTAGSGDGHPDLVVANGLANTVGILRGVGDGSFTGPTGYGAGSGPLAVAVGRFDGDGTPDIAAANYFSDNVTVLLGTTAGGFTGPTSFPTHGHPESVVTGTFDAGPTTDLAAANTVTNNVSILLGVGTGFFTGPGSAGAASGPRGIAVADLNGDSVQDLAVANVFSDNVSLLFGNGNGTFTGPTALPTGAGSGPIAIAAGNFNGDSNADLAVVNTYSSNVSILLGTGGGTFSAPTPVAVGSGPRSVAVGNFNGDGDADLAVVNETASSVSILLGAAGGTFTGPLTIGVGTNPKAVAVGDLNGDGDTDLAVANYTSDNVSILLGVGDGTFTGPTGVVAGDGPLSVAVSDFVQSDATDVELFRDDTTCSGAPVATGTKVAFEGGGITVAVTGDYITRFTARAIDAAGNRSACSEAFSYREDSTPPDTTIDSGPSGLVNTNDPSFAFHASELGSTFECRLDAGTWSACASPANHTDLAEGAHSFSVRAIDRAGNPDATPADRSFTVDTVAPDTTIDSGPSGPTSSNDPSFTFHATEAGSTLECKLDTGTWSLCTSPRAYADLPDGAHTFSVRATDAAGTTDPTPADRTFTVDTTAPDTTITAGPSGTTADATPTFEFTSSEAGSTFECRVDAQPYTSCASPFTTAVLDNGAHRFDVRAIDAVGHSDPTPAGRDFTVDTTAPDTQITSGPSGPTNNPNPTFTFTSEPGATFECRLDGETWDACTSPRHYTDLPDGDHSFEVRAIDATGTPDPTPASRAFTVETIEPDTTIDSGPSGLTADNDPSFTFSSDHGTTFECRLDAGAWGACTSPKAYTDLPDGPHTFEVRATDPAGDTDPTPASRSFTIDTTAPDTTISSGPSGPTNDSDPAFGLSSEAGATFECRLDAGAWDSCTSPKAYTDLADGAHTFAARATDPAGNTDATPATRSFMIDTVAPDTVIDSGPSGTTTSNDPSFSFHATEAGSTFECRLDAGAWGTCSSSKAYSDVPDGAHTFAVRATDPAENTDPAPAERSFTIDTTAPDTTITFGPTGTTTDPTPTFAFSADEGGVTFACRIDAGSFTACTTPHTTAALADGPHSFAVRATDGAGHTDPTPATRAFTVAATAPSSIVTWGNNDEGQTTQPAGKTYVELSAGAWFSLARRSDGSIAGWGSSLYGQTTPPAGTGYTAIAAGGYHALALRGDGSIAGWGYNDDGAAAPPIGSDYVAIAAGGWHSLALRRDGTLVGWGYDSNGQATVPFGNDYVAIAAGAYHSVALRGDGSIAAWGLDSSGQASPPPGNDYVAIAAGAFHSTALRGDGSVVSWGRNDYGQSTPPGGTGHVAIAAGAYHNVVLRSDGSVGAWGLNNDGQSTPPAGTDFVAVASGWLHSLALAQDATPPDTTITSGPTGLTSSSDPSFTFSSEPRASFECRLDGGSWDACSSPRAYSDLADGAHTFSVRATDLAGNTDPTPATRDFTIDTVAPDTVIDSGPSGTTTSNDPLFAFHATEAGSSFECRLDAGAWAACTSPRSYTNLSDSPHTFAVRATDPAGNLDPTAATRDFTIDTGFPDTVIDSGPAAISNDNDPSFTFHATEPGSTFECRLDTGSWAVCTSPRGFTDVPDGAHAFEVRATDPNSNTDETPASHDFTIDTTPPDTGIVAGPSGLTNDNDPVFEFASQDGATFECRLDDGVWAACTSPRGFTDLPDGTYSFQARATDPAGNTDPTPATREVTIDATAPAVTIDSGPDGLTNADAPAFTFHATEPGVVFQCLLDAGAWVGCGSPKDYPDLPDGDHSFAVRASDPAGNTGPASVRGFSLDTTPPETTIDSGPSGSTTATRPTFGFSSSEPGSSFQCSVDLGPFVTCVPPTTFGPLTFGTHTFALRAVDAAGNVDPTPASRTITIVAPVTTPTVTASGSPTPTPTPTTPQTIKGDQAFVLGVSNDLYLACTTLDLHLVDVLPAGTTRVAVTGAADLRLVGQTLEILLDGKPVGKAVVGTTGAFAAKVRAPARARRANARYQARIGTARSENLRLERRMVAATLTRKGSTFTFTGRISKPFAGRLATIAVQRYVSCGRKSPITVLAQVRPSRTSGRFSVTFRVPPASARALMYRASTKVATRAGGPASLRTYTLPRAIDLR